MKNIVSIKNLSKEYKSNIVLKNINLDIIKGDIYGIIGENGAGKTTLLKIIANQISNFEGQISIYLDDGDTNRNINIGTLIEKPAFHPNFSVFENLKLFYRLKYLKDNVNEVNRIIRVVGLEDNAYKKMKKLSMGMKQRFGIALSLIGNPELVILDEPTNTLDPVGIKDIRELIYKINKENNITFIISSHNLAELGSICNKYIIMHKGEILRFESEDLMQSTNFIIFEFEELDMQLVREYFEKINIDYIMEKNKIFISIINDIKYFITDLVNNNIIPIRVYESFETIESIYFNEMESLKND